MTRRSADPPRPLADAAHPSYLELDRFALEAPGAPTTAAHVGACDRCRRHVETLREAPPIPPGLRERLAMPAADASSVSAVRRWLAWFRGPRIGAAGLAGALAIAALLWITRAPHAPRVGYDGVKGLPSVWIYVKRDNELALWDGERPLEARDRLRMKVDPQDLTHVDVFTRDEAGGAGSPLAPIFDGRLPPGTVTTLPAAWQLDGNSPRESLIVVLSRDGVSAGAAQRFLRDGAPAGVWLRRFELHRSGAAPPPERTR